MTVQNNFVRIACDWLIYLLETISIGTFANKDILFHGLTENNVLQSLDPSKVTLRCFSLLQVH